MPATLLRERHFFILFSHSKESPYQTSKKKVLDFFRLFNYGIGIHLLEKESVDEYDTVNKPRPINPKDNHISFQCTDVGLVKSRLEDMGIRYATAVVEEGGIQVDQVFFHDPDGYMIEICNCDNLPVVPIPSCSCNPNYRNYKKMAANDYGVKETVMVDLRMNMMNFSF